VNLGNPEEVKVLDSGEHPDPGREWVEVIFTARPIDDPESRCPDISLARSKLG
jgi:dTDP-glucose 4,6-dehydratase